MAQLGEADLHENIIFKWIVRKWSGGFECIEVYLDSRRRLELVNAVIKFGLHKMQAIVNLF
jgi:hypothetical protein